MKLSKVWPGREGMGTDFANFSFLAQITLGLNQASLTMSALSKSFFGQTSPAHLGEWSQLFLDLLHRPRLVS